MYKFSIKFSFVIISAISISSCLPITADIEAETPALTGVPSIAITATMENDENYSGPYLIPVVSHLEVWGVTEDAANNTIWFLAKGELTDSQISLINYDGTDVRVYQAPASAFPSSACPRVSNLASDASGSIWFSNSCQVFHFNNGDWKTYSTNDGLPSWLTGSLAMDNAGNIWIGSDRGTFRFDGTGWVLYDVWEREHRYQVSSITLSPEGMLWFGGYEDIANFDGKTWNNYKIPNKYSGNAPSPYIATPYVTNIFASNDGKVWILNDAEPHLSYFDEGTWTTVDGIPRHYQLEAVLVEPNGHIWAGSHRLLYFDGEQWVEFESVARSIIQARDGTVWLGTEKGLYKIKFNE